jgi:hypothetical protein
MPDAMHYSMAAISRMHTLIPTYVWLDCVYWGKRKAKRDPVPGGAAEERVVAAGLELGLSDFYKQISMKPNLYQNP